VKAQPAKKTDLKMPTKPKKKGLDRAQIENAKCEDLNRKAEAAVADLLKAGDDDLIRVQACKKHGLDITKTNTIARRSKLGKLVFELLQEDS
jgi:hypothetical protein